MTDTRIESWLAERKRILAAAVGPLVQLPVTFDGEKITDVADPIGHCPDCRTDAHFEPGEGEWVADSLNHLPTFIAMVEAVLGRHMRVIADNHIDGPTAVCEECSEDRLFQVWPCETVRAIEAVIGDES